MKQVEIVLNLFTIVNEEVKVLLIRKQTEPYKGYWMLPRVKASNDASLKDSSKLMLEKLNFETVNIYENNTMCDFEREPGFNIINVLFVGFLDSVRVELNKEETSFEKEWFSINKLPKMAYNHFEIVNKNIDFLREKIKRASILNLFFPSDFSLPELQRVYETLLNIEIDRRNFRKKFLHYNLLEETGMKNEDTNGRPSKLYMFKENYEDVSLF